MVRSIIRPGRINIETALPFLRVCVRGVRRQWTHNPRTHNHNIESTTLLFDTCCQTFHATIGCDIAWLTVYAERRAQIGALGGDFGEGTGAAGCENKGGGAGVGIGVGYGGADTATGAEDADGEVGG